MRFDDNREIQERKKLLEEIQRRAEEAELARIDAEEARFSQSLSSKSLLSHDGVDVQERELMQLPCTVDDVDQTGASFLPLFPKPKNDEKTSQDGKLQIADLLESARSNYERENYEGALRDLNELFSVDENHPEAVAFRVDVEKACSISRRLQEEEERRRVEEEEKENTFAVPPPPAQVNLPVVAKEPLRKETREPKTQSPPQQTRRKGVARRLFSYAAIGALLSLGAVTAYIVYNNVRGEYFPPAVKLLVLPPLVTNVDTRIADGITNDLVTQLSHLRSVVVTSVKAPTHLLEVNNAAMSQVASFDFVFEWNVTHEDETYIASLSLVNVVTSRRILDRTLKFSENKLAEMCGEAASSVAHALDVDATDMQAAYMKTSVNKEAYDWYLLGRSMGLDGYSASLDSVAAVFSCARQSDPTYPYAESAFGWTNVILHSTLTDTSSVYLEEAAKSLKRAVSLGGTSAEVYRLWGVIEFFRFDYHRAILRLENAATIAPGDAVTQRWLALAYFRVGRRQDALRAGHAAVQSDAQGIPSRTLLGMLHLANGDHKSALNEFDSATRLLHDSSNAYPDAYYAALVGLNQHERALDMLRARTIEHPRDFVALYDLGRMCQLAGKPRIDWEEIFRRSLQLIEDTLKVSPTHALAYSYRGLLQTRLGLFTEGVEANKKALELSPDNLTILYNSARLFALQQNKSSEALEYLLKAINRRFSPDRILDLDFTRLRNDPSFAQVISK